MRMLNDKRWLQTKRVVWDRAQGLCEWCKRDGYITAGKDCHHIVPVETATTPQEMERLCFDVNNVRLLCIACHSAIHKGMGKGTRKLAIERAKQRQDRWAEGLMSKFTIKQEDNEV